MQPPKLLNDLYRDLRDRRLLVPAAALLVALVAVPVLLSSSPPPPPEPATAVVEPTAATPAVLAEEVGIRNYRERLEALKKKNPFDQKFAMPDIDEMASADSPFDDGTGDDGGTGSELDFGSSAPEPFADSHPGRGEGPPAGDPPAPEVRTEVRRITRLITRRIDVHVGEPGKMKRVSNVPALDFLPSDEIPVVAFLGVSENAKRAGFLVSADVVETGGEGSCTPAPPAHCQFLSLKVGEAQTLRFQPEGASEATTYRLKLVRVRDKVVRRSND